MLKYEYKVVKSLWVGPELSSIEQLSLSSFIACGHDVELFVYHPVQQVPEGVTLRDANDVLPESSVFRYQHSKSVSAFANWFRYKLLLEEGGAWVDTDVVCLKKFDFNEELFFGRQEYRKYNNAVLGGVKGHPLFEFLMKQAASPNDYLPFDDPSEKYRKWKRKYLHGNRRGNVRSGETGPHGLTRAVNYMGFQKYSLPYTAFYPIHPKCWDAIFDETYSDPTTCFPNSYAIHLWHEMFRKKPGFDKNAEFPQQSLIQALKKRYL